MDIAKLLAVTLYRAFDVDTEGRILAGSDATGSAQLVEIQPDGTEVPLTALPGACSGRYLPGQRAVIVSHDDGGNERPAVAAAAARARRGHNWPTWSRWCTIPLHPRARGVGRAGSAT